MFQTKNGVTCGKPGSIFLKEKKKNWKLIFGCIQKSKQDKPYIYIYIINKISKNLDTLLKLLFIIFFSSILYEFYFFLFLQKIYSFGGIIWSPL